MLQRLLAKRRDQTVMGHRIEEPRLTLLALMWCLILFGLPILALGILLDFLVQWATGLCIGLWCFF